MTVSWLMGYCGRDNQKAVFEDVPMYENASVLYQVMKFEFRKKFYISAITEGSTEQDFSGSRKQG